MRMDFVKVGWEGVNWMNQANYRDQWRAVVNTITNILIS